MSIGVVGRSEGEDLVKEEGVLEATLNRLDEKRREVPRGCSTDAERLAVGVIGLEDRRELLKPVDGAVVVATVGRVQLLELNELD